MAAVKSSLYLYQFIQQYKYAYPAITHITVTDGKPRPLPPNT